jgi:hypothetical protein
MAQPDIVLIARGGGRSRQKKAKRAGVRASVVDKDGFGRAFWGLVTLVDPWMCFRGIGAWLEGLFKDGNKWAKSGKMAWNEKR